MKKFIISLIALAVAVVANAHLNFVLQNGDRVQFFQKFDDAVNNIQSGDTLYLPGNIVSGINSHYVLNKKVCIIGAGYDRDSAAVTGITHILGGLTFDTGSEGSSVMGVKIGKDLYVQASSISISRCEMNKLSIATPGGAQPIENTLVSDCKIRGDVQGSNDNVFNTLIVRCILYGDITGGNKTNNMFVKNCLLLYGYDPKYSSYSYANIQNMTIENSIIISNTGYIFDSPSFNDKTSGVTLTNNLWTRAPFTKNSFNMSNNVFNVPLDDIFVDAANGDYHIKPTCTQALTLAKDGKQVGIYGTDHPFLVPTCAPRIISVDNAENVVDGKLSVKMKVEARNR